MKLDIDSLNEKGIDNIIEIIQHTQLQYHEYSFICENKLKTFLKNKLTYQISNNDSLTLVVLHNNEIMGSLVCIKEKFDSQFFGFDCFRIIDLLVFSSDRNITTEIVNLLLYSLEKKLFITSNSFHISFSLNNNTFNSGLIFNSLTLNSYFYIHTLLTFSAKNEKFEAVKYYQNEQLTIRNVRDTDVNGVAKLAETSFKYSRFHLDPFLDNVQAGLLLKQSAENSILNKFVDIMLVAEIKGKIVGYYSAKKQYISEFEKTIGDVVIAAVDSKYRGLGIFSKLNANLLNWFADNTDFSEMGTYLANSPVHKTWINNNLRLIRGSHQFSKFVSNSSYYLQNHQKS